MGAFTGEGQRGGAAIPVNAPVTRTTGWVDIAFPWRSLRKRLTEPLQDWGRRQCLSRLSGLTRRAERERDTLARAIRFCNLVHQFMHPDRVRESGRKR
jgi:hypothetical protein